MTTVSHDSETPAHGQQVITACAFIWHDFDGVKKVFLPKRADTKKFLPSVYELPGGHIDFGEDLAVGLKREIMEEFGREITLGDPFAAFTYTNEVKGSHSVEIIYFAKFIGSVAVINLNPDDHSSYEWAAKEDLPSLYTGEKGMDDLEVKHILRGFELLESQAIDFGN